MQIGDRYLGSEILFGLFFFSSLLFIALVGSDSAEERIIAGVFFLVFPLTFVSSLLRNKRCPRCQRCVTTKRIGSERIDSPSKDKETFVNTYLCVSCGEKWHEEVTRPAVATCDFCLRD